MYAQTWNLSKCDFSLNFIIMTDQHLYYNQNILLLTVFHYYNSNRLALHKEIKLVDIQKDRSDQTLVSCQLMHLCTWCMVIWDCIHKYIIYTCSWIMFAGLFGFSSFSIIFCSCLYTPAIHEEIWGKLFLNISRNVFSLFEVFSKL